MRKRYLLILALAVVALYICCTQRGRGEVVVVEREPVIQRTAATSHRFHRARELRRFIHPRAGARVEAPTLAAPARADIACAGAVLDARTGQPVGGAALSLRTVYAGGNALIHDSTTTMLSGTFALTAPDELGQHGSSRLFVKASGFAPLTVKGAALALLLARGCDPIRLQPSPRIAGRVVDVEGRSVGGAIVRLSALAREGVVMAAQTSTDGQGRFTLHDLPLGSHVVTASKMFVSGEAVQQVDLRGGERRSLRLQLREHPRALLRGRVVDSAGQPLYAVQVTLQPSRRRLQGAAAALTLTRAASEGASTELDGTFELEVPEPGWYVVRLRPYLDDPSRSHVGHVRIYAGSSAPQRIVAPGRVITCHLADADGRIVPFRDHSVSGGMRGSTTTMGRTRYSSALRLLWPRGLEQLEVSLTRPGLTGSVVLKRAEQPCVARPPSTPLTRADTTH